MGSSTLGREYQGRLFPAGKSPLQDRSLHHNCKLTEFGQLKHSVGEEVFNDVMSTSQVGIILKLASRSYMWCAKTCHNLLTHQLAIESSNEIWSLFGGRPIRTHFFWDLVGIKDGEGPSWHELNGVLGRCSTWTYEQKRMLALLFVVHIGIYGISRSSRISFKHAKRVLVPESFESYPWGKVGFKELMKSIKVANLDGKTYVVHGCVHALLIWAYEAIPIIGEEAGGDIKLDNMIPDIVGGCLDESCWETEEQLLNKKKRKKKLEVVVDSDDDLVEKPLQKISSLADEALVNVLNTIPEKLNELETKFELLQTNKTTVEEGSTKKRNEVGDEVAEEKVYDAESDTVGENDDKKGCEATPEPSWLAIEVETSQEGITITRTIRNPSFDYKRPTQRKLELNDPSEKLGGDSMAGKTPFIIPQLSDEDDGFLMKAFAANAQNLGRQGKQDKAKATYDPLEKVDRKKQVALVGYVKTYLDNPIESSSPEADFYQTLMTPKKQWVVDEYGWLSDMHMVAGMNMFRQRSLRRPCPYRNEKIFFLDL
ncbi:unnamed protein product [Microthlaspi erraticum]|uniref:DUF1985 domain-containing protein n=1 Tax=Microthlaspi erraticum TaxID=1685480 RepID=A0A6D2HFC0_9BRAS|nr:unnamed protein product [Microthlaspi erraticum]